MRNGVPAREIVDATFFQAQIAATSRLSIISTEGVDAATADFTFRKAVFGTLHPRMGHCSIR